MRQLCYTARDAKKNACVLGPVRCSVFKILSILRESAALFGPSLFEVLAPDTCRTFKCFLTWATEDPMPWPGRAVREDRGVLEVWFVGSMRFVCNHQLVHHAHGDDAEGERLSLACTHVLSAPALAARSRQD